MKTINTATAAWGAVVFIFLLGWGVEGLCLDRQGQQADGELIHDNFLKIHELNSSGFQFGTYETVGYVVKKYQCPPCQKDVFCKPCQQDHIVISEIDTLLPRYELSERELIVLTDAVDQFREHQKYRFLIQILNVKTFDQPLNNIKLIHSQEIE